jgi:uncharacterized membrane protein
MGQTTGLGWLLVIVGAAIVVVGLALVMLPSVPWLGRMPGDVRIERPRFQFYFPVVTCLLLSILVSVVLWVIGWFSGKQ